MDIDNAFESAIKEIKKTFKIRRVEINPEQKYLVCLHKRNAATYAKDVLAMAKKYSDDFDMNVIKQILFVDDSGTGLTSRKTSSVLELYLISKV